MQFCSNKGQRPFFNKRYCSIIEIFLVFFKNLFLQNHSSKESGTCVEVSPQVDSILLKSRTLEVGLGHIWDKFYHEIYTKTFLQSSSKKYLARKT